MTGIPSGRKKTLAPSVEVGGEHGQLVPMGDLIPFPAAGLDPDPYEAAVTRACEIIDQAVIDIGATGVPCALEIIAGEAISKLAQTSSPDYAVAFAVSFGRVDG